MTDILREAARRLRDKARELRDMLGQNPPPLEGTDLDNARGLLTDIDDDAAIIYGAIPVPLTPECIDVISPPSNAIEWSDQFVEWGDELDEKANELPANWQRIGDLASSLGDGVGAGCQHWTDFYDSLG